MCAEIIRVGEGISAVFRRERYCDFVTVNAEKGLDKDEEDKKGRIIRQERYAGALSRSFYIGEVKPEDVKATYESGVLTLLIPKAEESKAEPETRITIE